MCIRDRCQSVCKETLYIVLDLYGIFFTADNSNEEVVGIPHIFKPCLLYTSEGISPKKAENATTMTYLGTFEFELSPEGVQAVSYTHLDVYKRQIPFQCSFQNITEDFPVIFGIQTLEGEMPVWKIGRASCRERV